MYCRYLLRSPQHVDSRHQLLKSASASSPHLYGHVYLQPQLRFASSSSRRWQSRQGKDKYAVNARTQGLKSRAAFKLLEINEKYKVFKSGQTVVDLGYAPGSWSQVAVDRTNPDGRVVGIDVIPAQPPTGVSTIQGNFLSASVRGEVKRFLREARRSNVRGPPVHPEPGDGSFAVDELESNAQSSLEHNRQSILEPRKDDGMAVASTRAGVRDHDEERMVDVVLSDMSAPWEQTDGFWKRSLSDPYYRMMNTSGINFRDHAGSMDLCGAALTFASDTLRAGGHFICKFYQGSEDRALEARLRILFSKVHREKPESSRNVIVKTYGSWYCIADAEKESKEAFFVALKRKAGVRTADVMG